MGNKGKTSFEGLWGGSIAQERAMCLVVSGTRVHYSHIT